MFAPNAIPGTRLLPRAFALTAALALFFSVATAQDEGPPEQETVAAPVLVVPLPGHGEDGHFTIYVNEEPIVEMDHVWHPDGTFEGQAELSMAGQTIAMDLSVETDDAGQWTRIESNSPMATVVITREGNEAVIAMKGQSTQRVALQDGMVLFDNYQPALVRLAVEAYDGAAGGVQDIPVFVLPGAVLDVALEHLETATRAVAGRDMEVSRFRFAFPGTDMFLWTDENDRVLAVEVPDQHATFVREGFEGLLATPVADPLLSAPEFAWTMEDEVMVPMRDGVKLATDVYRPEGEGKHPVILVRTPYKKELLELQAKFYARRGYVYAVQDCRGRFASEGTWVPFFHEPEDGYDTIEWLADRDYSTGNVGMIGGSYVGWVQWWAAREQPPHLKAIIPNVAPPDPYFNIPYEYGTFFLTGAIWWADVLEQEATADISGGAMSNVSDKDYHELLKHLPVIELDEIVLGKKNPYWRDWIAHPNNDEWWARGSFLDRLADLELPVFHQSGWFDGDGIGAKLNYLAMASHGHGNQKLVVGPWGHTDTATRRTGGVDYGPAAMLDLQTAYLRWFDKWLKGVDNGIDREPLVQLFVMGANRWVTGDTYPLPETEMQRWYLHSDGEANTAKGDGTLSSTPPAGDETPDSYAYDPGDPTPTPRMPTEADASDPTAFYGRVDDERRDILVYQSEPFAEPLTIVGPITAVLYAHSSAKDTDWFVRISEVNEKGEVFFLVEGKIRARFRHSFTSPSTLRLDEIAEYHLDCWHTGIEIPAGRRLRVEVASASFPFFSRNLNTGGRNEMETEFVTAHQTIYHDPKYPSHIVLPVLPTAKK